MRVRAAEIVGLRPLQRACQRPEAVVEQQFDVLGRGAAERREVPHRHPAHVVQHERPPLHPGQPLQRGHDDGVRDHGRTGELFDGVARLLDVVRLLLDVDVDPGEVLDPGDLAHGVPHPGDHGEVGALQLWRRHQRAGHLAVNYVAGNQRPLHQGALQIKHLDVQAVLLEHFAFFGDPQHRHRDRWRAVADPQFVHGGRVPHA